MKYIEMRIFIVDEEQSEIAEIAEEIKDFVYNPLPHKIKKNPVVKDVTYEIKEERDENFEIIGDFPYE